MRVTGYYAAPQWHQVVATTDHLLDTFATHLGTIEDAFVRAPAELQRQWEEAKQAVGSLARVIGGECCCHAMCPIAFACTGCAYKIPDPTRREEIVQQRQWAFIRYEQVKRQGLGPETVKMQALIQRCDTELDEMDLMEEYHKDEAYTPELTIKRRDERTEATPSVAPETLRRETSAIMENPDAHTYYREHSDSYRAAQARKQQMIRKGKSTPRPAQPLRIDPKRDRERVRYRYLQMTKADLVERLLSVEQAYADVHQQLVQLQFQLIELEEKEQRQALRQSQRKGGTTQNNDRAEEP